MEPKKIKKLVINQEIISTLNENAQSKIKGGWFSDEYPCPSDTCPNTDFCPKETLLCDTEIMPPSDCCSHDWEICRWSEYHCNSLTDC